MKVTFKPRVIDGDSPVDPASYRVAEDIRITETVPKITTLFDSMRSTLPMNEIKPMEDHIAQQYLKPSLIDGECPEQRYDQVILCFTPKMTESDDIEIGVRSSDEDDTQVKKFVVSNSPEVDKLFGPSALEWSMTFGVPIFRTYHLDL